MKGLDRGFINRAVIVAALAFTVLNFDRIFGVIDSVKSALSPLFLGIIIAIIVNIPMTFFEKKLFFKCGKLKKPLSVGLSVVIVLGFLAGLGFLIIPQVVECIKELSKSIPENTAWLEKISSTPFGAFVAENLRKLYENTVNRFQDYLPRLVSYAQNIVKGIVNLFLGLFFALLMLINKDQLKRQGEKFLNKTVRKERLKRIIKAGELGLEKFSRFLGGQLLEAVILGIICYVCLLIMKMPYAALVAVITAVSNLVPMLGAYIGGIVSGLLIFTVSPSKTLVFAIFIVILQQVESVTTYPVIVGKYVGLSSFWILAAVVVGGGLFGMWGLFLGVPVTAFLHDFVGEIIRKKPYKTSIYINSE